MNVLCRGCRTEIDLNASNCPICLRPRDRSEMLEDSKRIRAEQAAAKKRPWIVLGWLLALSGAGYAGWTWRDPLVAAVDTVRSKGSDMLETASDPKTYAPNAPVGVAEPPTPAATPGAPAAGFAPRPQPPAAADAKPAPAAAEPPPHDWTLPAPTNVTSPHEILLRGWVYDLVKARPVPNARLDFRDRLSGAHHQVFANLGGYYEVAVPRENSGLSVTASTPGYRPQALEENDPPWHDRSPASRKKAALAEPGEILLTFTSRQDEAHVNLILLPLPPRRP